LIGLSKLNYKKGRNVEEMNYEGWMTGLAFLVDVTAHLNNCNEEL